VTTPAVSFPLATAGSPLGSALEPAITPNITPPPGADNPIPAALDLSQFGATPLNLQPLLQQIAPGQSSATSMADFGKMILANQDPSSAIKGNASITNQSDSGGGESFMQHVLDALSIGTYTSAGAFNTMLQGWKTPDESNKNPNVVDRLLGAIGGAATGAAHGIAGAFGDAHPGDKTDWIDVLKQHGPYADQLSGGKQTYTGWAGTQNPDGTWTYDTDAKGNYIPKEYPLTQDVLNGYSRNTAIQGLILDTLLDPLNLFGVGEVTDASKMSKISQVANSVGAKAGLVGPTERLNKFTAAVADATNPNRIPNMASATGSGLGKFASAANPLFRGEAGIQNPAGDAGVLPNAIAQIPNVSPSLAGAGAAPISAEIPNQASIFGDLSDRATGAVGETPGVLNHTGDAGVLPNSIQQIGNTGASTADLIRQGNFAHKINPDDFAAMMREVTAEKPAISAPVVKPEVVTPPPVAANITPGAFSFMRNETTRANNINKIVANTMRDGDMKAGQWGTHMMSQLHNQFGAMNGLKNTSNFIEHMADQVGKFNDFMRSPLNSNRFKSALNRVLGKDYEQHATSVMPASKIIDKISEGDPSAITAAAPKLVSPRMLSTGEAAIAKSIVEKYHGQVMGNGHWDAMTNPANYDAAIKAGAIPKWSGPKQANMLNDIASSLGNVPAHAKWGIAQRILRAVEDHFHAQGAIAHSGTNMRFSVPLRLSDVMAKMGPEVMANHPEYVTKMLKSAFSAAGEIKPGEAPELAGNINQAMQAAKAGSALSEAPAVQKGVATGEQMANEAAQSGSSDARISEATDLATKVAEDIARNAGASGPAVNTVRDIMRQMYVDSDKVQSAITKGALNTKTVLTHDEIKPAFSNANRVQKAITDTIGGPNPAALGKLAGPEANVMERMGAGMSSAYGLLGPQGQKLKDVFGQALNPAYKNVDMRPLFLQNLGTARALTSRQANIWNGVYRKLGRDSEMLKAGVLAAQGHTPAAVGTAAEAYGKTFLASMENLVGSSALKRGAELDQTVAGRGQLLMSELNKNLKRYGLNYQFTRGKNVLDAMGRARDYSDGTDWLKSWESWDIQDPMHFTMRISNAIQNTVMEQKMFEDIAARFGSATGTTVAKLARGSKTYSVAGHKYLNGIKFSQDHADQINQFIKNLEDFKKPSAPFLQLVDKVLSKYKTALTLYMPSHHIRTLIGDTYMAHLAGNNSIRNYTDAINVMRSQHGRYTQMSDLADLGDENAVQTAIAKMKSAATGAEEGTRIPKGSDILFRMRNGKAVTADMVYSSAFHKGMLPSANMLTDIPEEDVMIANMANKLAQRLKQPANGKIREWANDAAEYREHFIRLSHYIDALKKSGSSSFEEATEAAAAVVRKWHPDGSDLTDFERRVMRRTIPFYSWSRKAIPLIIESMAMRPAKVMAYPRAMYGAQIVQGNAGLPGQDTSVADPFPLDSLFPSWLREKGIGPIGGSAATGYTNVNPSIPTMDVIDQLGGLLSSNDSDRANSFSNLLNPGIRIPEEVMTGHTLGGTAINSKYSNIGMYGLKQIPAVSTYAGIDNITSPDPNTGQFGGFNQDKFLNFLFAAGISQDQNYQKQANNDYKNQIRAQQGVGF
jgi:hypothetical protein